ncbi:hypothetical protein WA026_009080 [Henosepilachna vigintioctopunctata]|uniref:MEIOB-like N-terminal domain-containing protein n=1 Tax=Henosepilachna vigintioctopunctata TaxID=420089 RepID=A0AAW1UPV7_9CUCU
MNDNIVLQRVTLMHLEPTIFNALIVGVIIAKQDPRQFVDSKSSDPGTSRAVLNFTFRDSPQDFINVTYWGKSDAIFAIDENFHVGDVVELVRPQITIRKYNDKGEQFRPKVTSPYSLTMNDFSNILRHDGVNEVNYKNLLRLPTKPPGFVPIRDIHNGGLAVKDTYADILGAVAHVGNLRTVKLKNGGEASLIEIILFDQTNPGIRVTFWNREYIGRASSWQPRSTILFITDLNIDWSGYHKSVVAKFSNKSILTENPVGREAEKLAEYAKTAPLHAPNIIDQLTVNLPDVQMIQNVMSVQQIQNRINLGQESGTMQNLQFTALLYGVITQLDLDGFGRLFTKKCGHCKTLIKLIGKCENATCPVALNTALVEPEISFDIRVTISDHTGTLNDCRLSGKTAEMVLDCSIQEFLQMSDDDKARIKWKYLLERCAIRLIVFSANNQKPIISIQSCSIPDGEEVVQRIPVY